MVSPKNHSPISFFIIPSIFLFSFFIFNLVSCDLFNNSDKDYLSNIDEEIAWANAERLTVQVAVPPGWGSSPQTARCYDAVRTNETPRKGYPFTVEFSPNSGYGFVEWLAFGNEYTLSAIAEMPLETARKNSLNSRGVSVSEAAATVTGAIGSSVTVNINVPVTLVPFCDIRPRLDQRTYPPVNPMQTPFPYDQPINLWFTLPIRQESAAGNIRISAVHTSDENLLGKKRGELFGSNGDLSNYYKMDFPSENRIDLIPKNSTEYPSNHLMLLSVTVEVGPGIESTNGHAMDAVEKINFQTDTNEAPKVYSPGIIWASRMQGSGYFNDSTEFRNPDIDRRFNRITTPPDNYNTVHIRFSATPPDDAPSPTPNRITVIERLAYDLRGFGASGSSETNEYKTTDSEVNYNIGEGEYTITHRLKTTQSGIIQLVVLPWYDDATAPIAPLAPDKAVAMSQYVSIVMDLSPPGLSIHNTSLSTPSSIDGSGLYVYGSGAVITVTVVGLKDLVDNGSQGGISAALAWSAPWTMDDPGNLYWYVQIGEDSQTGKISSPRFDVYSSGVVNNTWNPSPITGLTDSAGYRVLLKFEDRMGNVSSWQDTFLKLVYSDAAVVPVTDVEANCNAFGNQITVEWNTPAGMIGAYVSVNGSETRVDGTGSQSYLFSTTVLNTGSVRSGSAITNVTRYDIAVQAYNPAGRANTKELTIWNVPDMSVSETNPAVQINTPGDLKPVGDGGKIVLGLTTPVKSYVLMDDITVSSHVPIGISSTGAFQGKFYGNGHTITVNGISAVNEYHGIFGYVQDALIRDLRVEYADNTSISRSDTLYFGGITGRADATASDSTVIRNVIVGGNRARVSINNNASTAVDTYAGMITGYMQPTVLNENCYTGLNLEINASVSGIRAGGITGFISNETVATTRALIENATEVGNITATAASGSSNSIRIGGITGESQGRGIIKNSEVSGTLQISAISTNASADYTTGGIIGKMPEGQIASCNFTGGIVVHNTHNVTGSTYIGGVAGEISSGSASKTVTGTSANGNITVTAAGNGEIRIGGVIGKIESSAAGITVTGASSNGNITVAASGSGDIKIGGVCGSSQGSSGASVTFTNCESSGNTITFTKTGSGAQLNIGGFLGEATGYTELVSCNSRTPINIEYNANNGSDNLDNINIGGFVGLLIGNAKRCYSASPIGITINSTDSRYNVSPDNDGLPRLSVGGFGGFFIGNYLIEECYVSSSGAITIMSTMNEGLRYYVGGFAGWVLGGYGTSFSSLPGITFKNCYAAGNVMVDRSNGGGAGNVDVAGFAGSSWWGKHELLNCFAVNSVTVRSARTTGGGVGGLVGWNMIETIITKSAVFGKFISLQVGGVGGSFDLYIGRIGSSSNGTFVDNYAVGGSTDPFRMYEATSYGGSLTEVTGYTTGLVHYNGQTIERPLAVTSFWQNTLGFDPAVWNLGAPVTANNWPTLRNVGGTQ